MPYRVLVAMVTVGAEYNAGALSTLPSSSKNWGGMASITCVSFMLDACTRYTSQRNERRGNHIAGHYHTTATVHVLGLLVLFAVSFLM